MRHAIFMSGRGGQGVLLAGQIVAQAAVEAGLNTSWYPIYDPEVRGGRTTCMIVVADGPVGSPIAGQYTSALLMDEGAVERHLREIAPEGVAIVNTSLATVPAESTVRTVGVPATQMAEQIMDDRATNMVLLGALAAATQVLKVADLEAALAKLFSAKRSDLVALNVKAMEAGYQAAQEQL
ncbi:MAG TPA: 2-oxoacid:acceptor oxidoreductase family protein [Armatimonadota bacterium]|jgi:2-oxoglutarate ferredoxin oxidoreductase subunit gamma